MRQLAGKLLGVVLAILWSLPSLAPVVAAVSQKTGSHHVFASLGHGHVDLIFTHCDPTSSSTTHDHPLPTGGGHDEDHVVHLPHPDEQRLNRDTDFAKRSFILAEAMLLIQGFVHPLALTPSVAVPPPPDVAMVWLDYLHAALPPRAPSSLA